MAKTRKKAKPKARRKSRALATSTATATDTNVAEQIAQLLDRTNVLYRKIEAVDNQLQPLVGMQHIPSRADIDEMSKSFRSLRVFAAEARAQMSAMIDAKNFPQNEFVNKSTFDAWKAAIEQRLVALEKYLVTDEEQISDNFRRGREGS